MLFICFIEKKKKIQKKSNYGRKKCTTYHIARDATYFKARSLFLLYILAPILFSVWAEEKEEWG